MYLMNGQIMDRSRLSTRGDMKSLLMESRKILLKAIKIEKLLLKVFFSFDFEFFLL